MKILIIGAGSIGVYLGTLLFSKGHDVSLLGRNKLKLLRKTVLINNKKFKLPRKIYRFPKNKFYDYIFITSKLHDLETNLKTIIQNNLKTSFLISIQNGLVDNLKYHKLLGSQKLNIICVFEGYNLFNSELKVRNTKTGWKVENNDDGKKISILLQDIGVNCNPELNFELCRAEKTIANCSLNVLSAIEKKPFSELFESKIIQERIDKLINECYLILKTAKYPLQDLSVIKEKIFQDWGKMNHFSSTYQDAIVGKETEMDFLNSYIIQLGKKYKIPTPENNSLIKEFYKIYPKHR